METLSFYILTAIVLFGGLVVLMAENPLNSAFGLVISMVGLAFHYFSLGAYFIGGVQLAVYAGAVMVLFVMVMMLFDLKKETEKMKSSLGHWAKFGLMGVFLGALISVVLIGPNVFPSPNQLPDPSSIQSTKALSILLFDKYVLFFELLGVLLLVVAVGVVAVSRIQGGTHDRSE